MISRRLFLAGTATASVGVVAACAADAGTDAGTTSGGGSTPGATLVALADVPVGGALLATTAAGDTVVVAQPSEGEVVAFSATCTHAGCQVEPDAQGLLCPCHASLFDRATGAALQGPATEPLASVAVEVRDGQVVEA